MKPCPGFNDSNKCPFSDSFLMSTIFLSIVDEKFLPVAIGYWIWVYKISKYF